MDRIATNQELNLIKVEQRGFVLNERPESRKVHHASCESVSATTTQHPKYYSQDRNAAKEWLDRTFGTDGWQNCGYCAGLNSRRT